MLQSTESQRITPDNAITHQTLEQDVCNYLLSLGFKTYALPYHETLDSGVVRILGSRYDPTSLYIRARADRFAIHLQKNIQFEFDAKTHENSKYSDMTLELYPFILHLRKAKIGIKSLYCYRDPFAKLDCGFWFNEIPPIRQINIPSAIRMKHLHEWFAKMAEIHFKNVPVYFPNHRNGSGDPYLIVDKHDVRLLPSWKTLIAGLL